MSVSIPRLRELLSYHPSSGNLYWRFSRRGVQQGEKAGTLNSSGYILIRIYGKYERAHRAAWALMTGEWPAMQIDHIDGDKANNRWINLRLVTPQQNSQNRQLSACRGRSGLLGASWDPINKKYVARIGTTDGKSLNLGRFETPEEAHAAYVAAKRKLHEGCTI